MSITVDYHALVGSAIDYLKKRDKAYWYIKGDPILGVEAHDDIDASARFALNMAHGNLIAVAGGQAMIYSAALRLASVLTGTSLVSLKDDIIWQEALWLEGKND